MTQSTSIEENKRVARRYPEEVATEHDVDLIDEICAEDVIDHGPLGEVHGQENLKEQMKYFHSTFGDFTATVEDIVAEEDIVAMRVTLRGRHDGEFMGVEPTGEVFEVGNMVFTRVEGGKIIERWVQPDTLGLLQQLGAVDLPNK